RPSRRSARLHAFFARFGFLIPSGKGIAMKRNRNHRSIVRRSACLEPLEPRRLLAAGALDKSFSGDGKATVNLAAFNLIARDVAVQADGKTVIVGDAIRSFSPAQAFFAVARLNLDGTPDTTFGAG